MMQRLTYPRKIPFILCLILLACISFENQAQSVKRQCISSYGASTVTQDAAFIQTAGQSYYTMTSSGNTTVILQGFEQPAFFKAEAIYAGPLKNLNVTVFPNPAAFSVTLQSDESIENSLVRVTDMNGRVILSEQVMQLKTHNINCGTWKNGIYIITVSDQDQNTYLLKLTINKYQ